jgi:mannose-6-phosphate isomerase class I
MPVPLAIPLRPDNFTPPSRTPWGGTKLRTRYKRGLGLATGAAETPLGESWELSVADEFHTLTASGEPLGTVLARDPAAMLGDEARQGGRSTSLLVKWLDAADDLSLQIHPEDDYAGLAPLESGKIELWYVVDHEPGAGLYLGFKPNVREADVRSVLRDRADLSTLMTFVPVERGDVVLIEPGTPHAVGRGVTLLEPQLVVPGRRAVTYRYWDWNRRYRPDGTPGGAGTPRALHVEHALAVTRWDRATDPGWLASRRAALGWPEPDGPARIDRLCGPEPGCALPSPRLRAARLCGTGAAQLPAWNALRALTVVEGALQLVRGTDTFTVPAGTTVAVPACSGARAVELDRAHALVAAAAG